LLAGVCVAGLVAVGLSSGIHGNSGERTAHRDPVVLGETVVQARGRWSWHFRNVSPPGRSTGILLINPSGSAARVWVRFGRGGKYTFQPALVPPGDVRLVGRSSVTAGVMDGAVTIEASRSIVPIRVVRVGTSVRSIPGTPGAGNPATGRIPMPARAWRFPALTKGDEAVVLTIFNPGASAVVAVASLAGDSGRIRMPVLARRSVEVSLSSMAPRWAAASLGVRASGDIIPERTVVGERRTTFSYGLAEQGGR